MERRQAVIETPPSSDATGAVIVVDAIHKQYDNASSEAVGGVSLEIHRGEVFGLLGPNGAGKTTLIETMTGFRKPTSGSVRVLGLDPTNHADRTQLRARTAIVLQHTGFPRYLTALETLEMIAAYHSDPLDPHEVLELVGLGGSGSKYVRELSGGQQRRLDVGAALMGKPEVVFLDEPTTGFDPGARRTAWDLVARLRDFGTTIVLTTHYMDEAQVLSDRVAVMVGGRIADVGTAAELADRLQLENVVRFRLPRTHRLEDLPESLPAAHAVGGGVLEIRSGATTQLLADLCGWAVANDVQLEGLEVVQPRLEDTYLKLTGDTA